MSRRAEVGKSFSFQVSGRSEFIPDGAGCICKQWSQREASFYQSQPKELREFMPKFKGIVDKKIEENDLRSESQPDAAGLNPKALAVNGQSNDKNNNENGPALKGPGTGDHCNQQGPSPPLQYLLLEDLTHGFRRPSIVDLKMGTRLYGDWATEDKKKLHASKCAQSTSASLGIRLCGSLWFDPQHGRYRRRDKYHGRYLSARQFAENLVEFFSDGKLLRSDVVQAAVEQVKDLRKAIGKMDTYRFYSGSLLIIYESSPLGATPPSLAATSTSPATPPEPIRSTIPVRPTPSSARDKHFDGDDYARRRSGRVAKDHETATSNGLQESPAQQQRVLVRMIDFAQTTFQGFLGDPVSYEGPDQGYITGLDTIVRVLEDSMQ